MHRQLQTRADGRAVDRADHRHRRGVDRHVQFDQPVGVVGGERVAAQVGARAEHGALPGQHDGVGILAGRLLDRLAYLLDELGVERIAPLGTLQLNGQHVFDAGDTNHLRHFSSSLRSASSLARIMGPSLLRLGGRHRIGGGRNIPIRRNT